MSAAASETVERDILKDLLDAAVQIESLQGEIASTRERINTVKAELVKAHGIKLIDFNNVLRWRSLSDEDRGKTLADIKTLCKALSITGQADMFKDEPEVDLQLVE